MRFPTHLKLSGSHPLTRRHPLRIWNQWAYRQFCQRITARPKLTIIPMMRPDERENNTFYYRHPGTILSRLADSARPGDSQVDFR